MEHQHYFSANPAVAHNPHSVTVYARGTEVQITTDSGVFAKKGLDFGSRLLIETVDLERIDTAVDLGCGYGVVAAILGKAYPQSHWVLLDVNQRAVELARRNTAFAGERMEVQESDGFSAVPNLHADAVLLNPPIRAGKSVVYRLFAEAAEHLSEHGTLWVVMHKKHGADSAKKELARFYAAVELADRDAGYHVFKCSKDHG